MRIAVLLVGPSASALAETLDGDARLDALAADSAAAARAYLSGTAFDRVVFLGPSGAESVARDLGLDTLTLDADTDADGIVRALRLGPTAARGDTLDADGGDPDRGEAVRRIQALRAEIDRVAHDLNNPVAVILGNAQLARALGTDLGDDVSAALADIETAAEQLATRARELGALRTAADGALAALGHSRGS